MITLIDKLNNKIKEDDYFLDENREIIKEKVKTASLNLDDHLMSILLGDEDFKSAFFIEKNGVMQECLLFLFLHSRSLFQGP